MKWQTETSLRRALTWRWKRTVLPIFDFKNNMCIFSFNWIYHFASNTYYLLYQISTTNLTKDRTILSQNTNKDRCSKLPYTQIRNTHNRIMHLMCMEKIIIWFHNKWFLSLISITIYTAWTHCFKLASWFTSLAWSFDQYYFIQRSSFTNVECIWFSQQNLYQDTSFIAWCTFTVVILILILRLKTCHSSWMYVLHVLPKFSEIVNTCNKLYNIYMYL